MLENWPIYFNDRLIIDNLDSNIGVATLWMPKENVASVLKPGTFSVCGQLYTKRGINPLLRNILANPKIRYIVLCGVDRQGSGEALVRFFKNGVKEDSGKEGELKGWRILEDDEALLDKEIPLEALELVRENVELIDLRMKPLEEVESTVSALVSKDSFAEPQVFPEAKLAEITKYPSDLSVFKIRRDTIGDAWLDVLKTINRFGATIDGMYGQVKEVHNLAVVIEKEDPQNPKLESFFNFNHEGLDLYIKGFFEVELGGEVYKYGERIFNWDGINQQQIMISKLKGFPYDRGAVAVLWKPHKDNYPPQGNEVNISGQTKGWRVPCLVMILGQCIDQEFHMTAVFRSNDIYGAWPLNAFALRKFQQDIAVEIGKNLGSLTTISHIAEIYENDWQDSDKIVRENDTMSRDCKWDSRGYYTIELDGDDIVLRFFSPDGATQLAEFKKNGKDLKAARDLCNMAIKDLLVEQLGAAADLGRQLAKAEAAVKLGLKFVQDQPLNLTS